MARAVGMAMLGVTMVCASGARAADAGTPWLDEVRIGGAGTLPIGGGAANVPASASVELQALFSPLPAAAQPYNSNWAWLFSPRPLIGLSISAEGQTNSAYAALAWDVPITDGFFAELSAGGMVHDQVLDKVYTDRPSPLASRFMFHESVALGRQFAGQWSILAFLDHASNGNLAHSNVGITRAGVMLGRAFGTPAARREAAGAAPPVAAGFSWAGPYIGVSVGLAHSSVNFLTPPTGASTFYSVGLGPQVGYNWMLGRVLTGVETDVSVQGLRGQSSAGAGGSLQASSHWLSTVRGRLGVDLDLPIAPGRLLLYGTGGAAFSEIVNGYCPTGCSSGVGYFDQPAFRTGWTAGGGFEVPIAPNASVRLEYLYVDFGKLGFSNPLAASEQFIFTEQLLRAGMNFNFN